MATTIVITIKSGRSTADVAKLVKDTTEPREECVALSRLFERMSAGLEVGSSFDVQSSASAPVRATQVLTLTYASITTEDTFVVAGVTFEAVTGTPSSSDEFKKQTDATTTAANLVKVVNAHATANLLVKASNVAGVVTFTSLAAGQVGNFLTLVGSTGMVATGATFTGGTGASETIAVNYSRG